MDCIITMRGNGVGRYGVPKNDRTGPVSEFIVDNQYFYSRVLNHVKDCDKCNPTAILTKYLERRKDIHITTSLVKLAYRYQKLNRGIPKTLIREYEIRSGINTVVDRSSFNTYELAQAVKSQCEGSPNYEWWNSRYLQVDPPPDRDIILALVEIVRTRPLNYIMSLGPDSNDDLAKLISVVGVMNV